MLTKAQIRWAASHDWFVGDNLDGTITIYTMSTEDPPGTTMIFRGTFAELRAFAGY